MNFVTNPIFAGLFQTPVVSAPNVADKLIDVVGVIPFAAYGLRKLRDAYSGALIRVRRVSDDAELDIGEVDGELDQSAIFDFIPTGDGYVAIFYDQSGNNADGVQTNAAKQAQIVADNRILTDAHSKPCVRFIGAAGTEYTLNLNLDSQYPAISMVANLISVSTSGAMFFARNGYYWQTTNPSSIAYVQNTVISASDITDSTYRILLFRSTASATAYKIDTTEYTGGAPTSITGGNQTWQIGTYPAGAAWNFDGNLQEYILFPELSRYEREVLYTNQSEFYGL